jgi:hypothetical protein
MLRAWLSLSPRRRFPSFFACRSARVRPAVCCSCLLVCQYRDSHSYYAVTATFKMACVHPSDPSKTVWREAKHTFTPDHKDRGFNDLLKPEEVAEFTHADGCIVLNVQAFKTSAFSPVSSYPAYTPYDSKSSTGYCGLLNQGATSVGYSSGSSGIRT